jgi:hypothetical protein
VILLEGEGMTNTPDNEATGVDEAPAPLQPNGVPELDSLRMSDRLVQIHETLGRFCSSPHIHDVIELVLAVTVSRRFTIGTHPCPLWLLVVGGPSSGKTDSIMPLKGHESVYFVDNVTENSFLSGYVERGKGVEKQFLDELDGKTWVVKELTALLSMHDDKVRKVLGDLTAIYDGEYSKQTGTRGLLQSKSRFSMVACITPKCIRDHQRYMDQIGPRFLFIRIPSLTDDEKHAGLEMLWNEEVRATQYPHYGVLMRQQIGDALNATNGTCVERSEHRSQLNGLATLLTKARGVPITSRVNDEYEVEEMQVEEPFRALQQLRTLGRGLACIHGRPALTNHELELLRRVVMSSIRKERADALACIAQTPGIDRNTLKDRLGKSYGWADNVLADLCMMGLATKKVVGGNHVHYHLIPELPDLVEDWHEPLDHLGDLVG